MGLSQALGAGLCVDFQPRGLTTCVLISSPTVMYTMGLATATMSEYSSMEKRSSGSGTWQALQMNFLFQKEGMSERTRLVPSPFRWPPSKSGQD